MAPHPGHVLRDAFLAPLGLSLAEFARGLGVEGGTVERLLEGALDLTPGMAARLGRYFQVPALWFLQMQAVYDADRVGADAAAADGVDTLSSGAVKLSE